MQKYLVTVKHSDEGAVKGEVLHTEEIEVDTIEDANVLGQEIADKVEPNGSIPYTYILTPIETTE
jgi:hypothetical protein